MMRRLRSRKRDSNTELNITAYINLVVILVPFLLVTAVFSRIAIMELTLPGTNAANESQDARLHLEITVRSDRIEVADRGNAPIVIANRNGAYNFGSLSDVVKAVKTRFPAETSATVLLEPDIPYETMIHVMDVVRIGTVVQAATPIKVEMFPEISIGDAPSVPGGA